MRMLWLTAAAWLPLAAGAAAPQVPALQAPWQQIEATPATLSTSEQHNASQAQAVLEADDQPVKGASGRMMYLYGSTVPTVVCKPLNICDIELEVGEVVAPGGLNLGDTTRWIVHLSVHGTEAGKTTHLLVKPTEAGLDTTGVIITNRRAYYLNFKSDPKVHMPMVGFNYRQQLLQVVADYHARAATVTEQRTLPRTREVIDQLDFAYTIDGNAPWRPVRVYNNGTKTIIQMPDNLRNHDAPVLLVLNGDTEMRVNYRLRGDRYIVDQVFDKAVLIAGVGDDQQKITLQRGHE